jgi:hypothetical protein
MSRSLSRSGSVALWAGGALLAVAAWPLAFLAAVFAGGGHGSPFGHRPSDAAFGAALLGVPALLFLLGNVLMWTRGTSRRRLTAIILVLIPVDVAVAAVADWQMNQPEPPVFIATNPGAVLPGRPLVTGQPVIAVVACSPRHGCTSAPRRAPKR